MFSRVWAGQRGAARDVYSCGKGKHQAISKCGIYLQLNSCIHLHEYEVHPTDREPAATRALSGINPWNCREGTAEHQVKQPAEKSRLKFSIQQHREDSPVPELNLGAEEPPHSLHEAKNQPQIQCFNPVKFKPSALLDSNAIFLFRAGSEV